MWRGSMSNSTRIQAYLAATAAMRGGAGQVRLVVGGSIHPILAVKCTEVEVACVPDDETGALKAGNYEQVVSHFEDWGTVGVIWPGLGRDPGTWHLVELLLSNITLPLVIDADGLNALAEKPDLLVHLGVF